MSIDTFHKNLEVIARGKGSPQARYCDEECEICDEDEIRGGHKDEPRED